MPGMAQQSSDSAAAPSSAASSQDHVTEPFSIQETRTQTRPDVKFMLSLRWAAVLGVPVKLAWREESFGSARWHEEVAWLAPEDQSG